MDKFILDGHKVVPCDDLLTWGKWFETADRIVSKTILSTDVQVSTVFLGLNHSFGDRVPLLFETMVFGGKHDQEMERYSNWQDAEEGHKRWVDKLKLVTEG